MFWKLAGDAFENFQVFVAQKLTELQIFGCQGYTQVNLGKL